MIRTNKARLVEMSVPIEVNGPEMSEPYQVSADGRAYNNPWPHGICYALRVGDPAFGWAADHTEPGATTEVKNRYTGQDLAMSTMVCIGNRARVVSGGGKGGEGVVTGFHGGFFTQAVLIDFPQETIDRLAYGDRIMIRAAGRGLALTDYAPIKTVTISPALLEAMDLQELPDGRLGVPVSAVVPSYFMGSGMGSTSEVGDVDLMTNDKNSLAEHGLDKLRIGDLIAILNQDGRYGHSYHRDFVAIGIIAHGDSQWAGHGPGVVTLFSGSSSLIQPTIDPRANIAYLLNLREYEE